MAPTLTVRSVDGRVGVRIGHRALSVAHRSWLDCGGMLDASYSALKLLGNEAEAAVESLCPAFDV